MNNRATTKTLGEFIRTQRELANLSLRQLADLANVSNPYLSQVERGLYKPSAEVLKAIAHALELSVETFFTQAGLLDGDTHHDAGDHVVSAIKLDARLTTAQKETLIRVYRDFVAER